MNEPRPPLLPFIVARALALAILRAAIVAVAEIATVGEWASGGPTLAQWICYGAFTGASAGALAPIEWLLARRGRTVGVAFFGWLATTLAALVVAPLAAIQARYAWSLFAGSGPARVEAAFGGVRWMASTLDWIPEWLPIALAFGGIALVRLRGHRATWLWYALAVLAVASVSSFVYERTVSGNLVLGISAGLSSPRTVAFAFAAPGAAWAADAVLERRARRSKEAT